MNNDTHKLLDLVGIPLDLTITLENWTAHLAYAMVGWQNATWNLADVLNHPMADTDQGQQAIADFLNYPRFHGLKEQTLLNIKSVGRKFSPDVRRPGIPFTFYQEASSLPLTGALELIEEAEKGHWTTKELREAVREARNENAGHSRVVSEEPEDPADLVKKLKKHIENFQVVLSDKGMPIEGLRVAAKPLIQALKELMK